jgi:hypothetical protein
MSGLPGRKMIFDQKVAALKDKIDKLEKNAGSSSDHRKGKQGTNLITAL